MREMKFLTPKNATEKNSRFRNDATDFFAHQKILPPENFVVSWIHRPRRWCCVAGSVCFLLVGEDGEDGLWGVFSEVEERYIREVVDT